MAKVGRNEPCPCGSGKKYKCCHGSPVVRSRDRGPESEKVLARAEAERVQRERQQGLGKPIISVDHNGQRLVAVKNRLMHSKRWVTFFDFLGDYIKAAMGSQWGGAEIAKPLEDRHPVLLWYQKLCDYQQTFMREPVPGKVYSAPRTGAVSAYYHLAYDLYALDHNAELQDKLLARLRNYDKFTGARYEVYVAATFIRAGFNIEFEDESDGNTTHCEFTATHKSTGKRFSVEAKRREGQRIRIGSLFNSALSKHADYQRVIFIDVNTPDDATGEEIPNYLRKALWRMRSFEGQTLNGEPRPPAYVFVTNAPWDLYLDAPEPRSIALAEGFQIPDFKSDVWAELRSVIDAREAHIEMHDLMKSLKDHSDIPSTFDGEMPEYAFNPGMRRILIGERYMLKDCEGIERSAEVTAATVNESQRVACCGVTFEDGRAAMYMMPLSDEELAAWRRHPDSFFGVVGQRSTEPKSALEFYDFLHGSFKRESKEGLLELMAGAHDLEQLAKLDQPRLASIYCERLANAVMFREGKFQGQ